MVDSAGLNAAIEVLRREKAALEAENERLRQALHEAGQREGRQQESARAERQLHAGALAASEGRGAIAEVDARAAWARAAAIGADLSRRIAEGQARLLASQASAAALEKANAGLAAGHAALALREADLRAIIESAVDCAIITTDLGGVVLAWNFGASRLLGWDTDSTVLPDLGAAFAVDNQPGHGVDADVAALLRGERVAREARMIRLDGSRPWVGIEAMPLRTASAEAPAGVLWMLRDRSAQREAEQARRASEARLAALLEQLPMAVGLADREGRWVLSNTLLRDIMGDHIPSRDPARMAAWRAWDDAGNPLDPSLWPAARALRGETVRPGIECLHTGADGKEVWYRVKAAPFHNGSDAVAGVIAVVQDIDAERRARDRLRESEERFRLIVENARDYAILVVDEQDIITDWLPGATAVFGWTAEEALGRPAAIIFTPEDQAAGIHLTEFEAARRDGSAPDVRWHRRKDGSRVFIEGRVMALAHPNGQFRGVLKIGQDVTERKRSEERQALLSREVDHRAKNALALVQSMMRLTQAETVEDFVATVRGRVDALARVHSLLARGRWDGAEVRTLVEAELRPFLEEGDGPLVRIDGPRAILPPGVAQPLAMALHELMTNAVKHGALSTPSGSVSVAWTLDRGSGAEGMLRLRWTETGGPPITGEAKRRGVGSSVIEGAVQTQMGGELSFNWESTGLVCEIGFPLGGNAVPGGI